MKRRIVTVGLLVLLLAGLIAVCIAVRNRGNDGDVTPPADTGIEISNIKSSDIVGFSVKNAAGEVSLSCYSDVWKLDGEPDFPVNQQVAYSFLTAFRRITATRQLKASEVDPSAAGLLDPVASASVKLTDGTELHYRTGNYNTAAQGLYLMTEDDEWVYLTDSAVLRGLSSLTRMSLAAVDTVPDATVVRKVTVGADNTENQASRIAAWSGLEFAAAVEFAPDASALAAFGLSEETRQVVLVDYTVTTQVESNETNEGVRYDTEHTAVLYVGSPSAENPSYTYVMLGGSQMVCIAPTDRLALLLK